MSSDIYHSASLAGETEEEIQDCLQRLDRVKASLINTDLRGTRDGLPQFIDLPPSDKGVETEVVARQSP